MGKLRFYLVSYDITDEKRLREVRKTIKGFGVPLQYSVYRCDLSKKGKIELISELDDIINKDEDSVMIIDLGYIKKDFEKDITVLGKEKEFNREDNIIL